MGARFPSLSPEIAAAAGSSAGTERWHSPRPRREQRQAAKPRTRSAGPQSSRGSHPGGSSATDAALPQEDSGSQDLHLPWTRPRPTPGQGAPPAGLSPSRSAAGAGCGVPGAGCGGPGLPTAGSPGAVTAPPPPPLNHPLPAARITNAAGSSGLDPASRAGSSLLGWIPLPGLCKAPVPREGEGMERGSSAPNPAPAPLGSPGPAARAPALPLGAGLGREASCPAGHRPLPPVTAKLGLDTGLILAPNPAPGALPSCRNTNRNNGEVNTRRFFLPSLKTRSGEDGQGD